MPGKKRPEITESQKQVLRNVIEYFDGTMYVNYVEHPVRGSTMTSMIGKGLVKTNGYDSYWLTPAGITAKKELEDAQ